MIINQLKMSFVFKVWKVIMYWHQPADKDATDESLETRKTARLR